MASRPSVPKTQQLNIRLDASEMDVLAAAAFVLGTTPTEIARECLGERLTLLRQDDEIRQALAIRTRSRANAQSGVAAVVPISEQREAT